MRGRFHEQLNELDVQLMNMGTLCEDAIHAAIRVLLTDKEEKIKVVRQVKVEIEEKGREIEDMCMQMLIRQQPVARDMNTISYALKLIRDMDRIGAQAVELSSIAKDIAPEKMMCSNLIHLMSDGVVRMVSDAVGAYVRKDADLAEEVINRDDTLDKEYLEIKERLTEMIFTNREEAGTAIDVLMIAKYLERIGDHAVNIATWVSDIVKLNQR